MGLKRNPKELGMSLKGGQGAPKGAQKEARARREKKKGERKTKSNNGAPNKAPGVPGRDLKSVPRNLGIESQTGHHRGSEKGPKGAQEGPGKEKEKGATKMELNSRGHNEST
jgi:hypothetical protein